MRVHELIEKLKRLPQEALVITQGCDCRGRASSPFYTDGVVLIGRSGEWGGWESEGARKKKPELPEIDVSGEPTLSWRDDDGSMRYVRLSDLREVRPKEASDAGEEGANGQAPLR
jgi:hypothetical protein